MPPPSHPTKFIQIAAGTLGILYALDDTGDVWIWVPTIASPPQEPQQAQAGSWRPISAVRRDW